MYQKKIKIEAPLAKPRFMLISNYDKLLHVSLTFVALSFLWALSPLVAIPSVIVLQMSKELFDWYVGDEFGAILGDLVADGIGWGLFLVFLYF